MAGSRPHPSEPPITDVEETLIEQTLSHLRERVQEASDNPNLRALFAVQHDAMMRLRRRLAELETFHQENAS